MRLADLTWPMDVWATWPMATETLYVLVPRQWRLGVRTEINIHWLFSSSVFYTSYIVNHSVNINQVGLHCCMQRTLTCTLQYSQSAGSNRYIRIWYLHTYLQVHAHTRTHTHLLPWTCQKYVSSTSVNVQFLPSCPLGYLEMRRLKLKIAGADTCQGQRTDLTYALFCKCLWILHILLRTSDVKCFGPRQSPSEADCCIIIDGAVSLAGPFHSPPHSPPNNYSRESLDIH